MRPEASPARPLCAACGGRDPVPGGAATYCRACGGYAAAHTSTGFADLIPPPGRHGFHAPAEPPPWVREQLTDDEVYFYDPLAGAHFGVRDGDWEEWRNVREIKPRNGVFPLGGKSDFCLTCGADVAPGEHTCAACVGVRPCRSCGGRGSQPLFGYAGQRASAQCRACRGTGRQRTSAATTPSIIDVDDARAIGVLEGLALARGIEVTP